MLKLLMFVPLLVVASAYADNLFEWPMDAPISGWGCDVAIVTEGDRTFTRGCNFNDDDAGGMFYVNTYLGGEVDVSGALTFECDVRWHQEGPRAYENAYLALRIGSPGYGEIFVDPIFHVGVLPPDSVGDTWYHISVDLTGADQTVLQHMDGFEFFADYGNIRPTVDYVDMDSVVFTPEPNSLMLLLGLGLVAVARRR